MDMGDQWHGCSWMGFFMQMGAHGDGDPRSVGAQQGWVPMSAVTLHVSVGWVACEDGCLQEWVAHRHVLIGLYWRSWDGETGGPVVYVTMGVSGPLVGLWVPCV